MGRGDRPELAAPPEVFYDDEEARKYTANSRMIEIQVRRKRGGGGSFRPAAAAAAAAAACSDV